MSGKRIISKASAPGKAILFGEQAVVHGATAIAAAVSDLRIEVDMVLEEIDGADDVLVVFEDLLLETNEKAEVKIPFSFFSQCMPIAEGFSLDVSFIPDTVLQTKLQSEFSSYPNNVASGLITVSFFVGYILLPCIDTEFSSNHRRLRVSIQSKGLPIGAGLGSSAAFSVAASAASFQLITKLKEEYGEYVKIDKELLDRINSWAYSGEVLMHGNPSGLDNTTSSYGGLVSFVKDPTLGIQFSSIPNPPKMRILLVNTKVPRSTRHLVANVTELYNAQPTIVQPLFNSVTEITKTFQRKVEELATLPLDTEAYDSAYTRFVETTGQLMDINHHILNAIGVGHPALTKVVEVAKEADCHAKLTGAGGGGCAIVLLPSIGDIAAKETELTNLLRSHDFEVFVSDIAGSGVQWHD